MAACVIKIIHDASRRALDQVHNSPLLVLAVYLACPLVIFMIPYVDKYYVAEYVIKPGKQICENLGFFWCFLIIFMLYAIISDLSRVILGERFEDRSSRRPPPYIFLLITLSAILLISWCIWILVQFTVALTVFALFIVIKTLITPYLFFDSIVLRFKLASTLIAIGLILGLTGTLLEFIE